MRRAAIYSAALHVAVFAIAWFGVPALFSTPPVEDTPITVDLVSLQDVTRPPPEPEPPKPAPPPPEAKPAPPPPPPPPATSPEPPLPPPVAVKPPEPPPAAKPEPPPPPPEPKPKPVARPEPKPKPEPPPQQAETKPAPQPKAVAAPPPKRKPERKPEREDQFQALLKNLAKQKEAQQRSQKPEPQAKPAPAPVPAPQQVARAAVDRQLSERRLTALVKQQIHPCWSIPAGAKDAQNMRVAIQIRLNTDGTLRGRPHVLDEARMRTDRVYRAVAESAVRALLNPRCSPLKLPYEEYDIWRNITFNFDPGEALGQ